MQPEATATNRLDHDWSQLEAEARRGAARLAVRFALQDSEDLAQEALLRCLEALHQKGAEIERPSAWMQGTLKRLVFEERRRLSALDTNFYAQHSPPLGEAAGLPSDGRGPLEEACLNEAASLACMRLGSFPPPYRQIATLQYLVERGRREIVAWLRCWRPVGEDEGRRLLIRTHAMLRALGAGTDLTLQWPAAFNPKKNHWLTTPLPPLPTRWSCMMPECTRRLVLGESIPSRIR